MTTPSATTVACVADGANAQRLLQIDSSGALELGGAGSGTYTRPSCSLVVNVADGSDGSRLLGISATGTVVG